MAFSRAGGARAGIEPYEVEQVLGYAMGGDDAMSGQDEHDQVLRDAQATVVGEQVRQARDAGDLTFSDYLRDEAAQILACLPPAEEVDRSTMPTSVRLPLALYQRLRAHAEEHNTSASTLIREWVEQMLAIPDRPISLADAVRALSTLPSQDQQQQAA